MNFHHSDVIAMIINNHHKVMIIPYQSWLLTITDGAWRANLRQPSFILIINHFLARAAVKVLSWT